MDDAAGRFGQRGGHIGKFDRLAGGRALPGILRRPAPDALVPWLLLAGLLGIALLRCAMIAFVEVSSFGIGTSTMYLSTVHPLFLLYAFLSLAAYGRPIRRKERAL